MEENINLSEVEEWQKFEDDRLEYQGYCNKISQGIDNLDSNSGERAIWELVQNARDMKVNYAQIKIELNNDSITFSHHGKPFDYTSFRALVKQDSSKDKTGVDLVGQYGTGFMTTHIFNKKVLVSCPFEVKDKNEIKGYVQIKDFELDRTKVSTTDGPKIMKAQLDKLKSFYKQNLHSTIVDDRTTFKYELTPNQVDLISKQLSKAIQLIPFVLIINKGISEMEIVNHYRKEHFTLKKVGTPTIKQLGNPEWKEISEEVQLIDNLDTNKPSLSTCKSLQSVNGDVIIIPPFPESSGAIKSIPSLFLWFPLLGTESFGVNFIFHSKRFHPVEKRNNIMLPGATDSKREKGGENNIVLKEMMDVLFAYYGDASNAKSLPREFCDVSFPIHSDDDETKDFYSNMQKEWNAIIPNWKFLPIKDGFFSISDSRVKLLHPDFYDKLNDEQRVQYEQTLSVYAHYPKQADGSSYLMPESDLIKWSETVNRWGCDRNNEFFISILDVCKAIQSKSEDLYSFLMLMKDNGKIDSLDEYPLFPNRFGELRRYKELFDGEFLSDDVFTLVNVLMGNDSKKIFDPVFRDICSVTPYTEEDLRNAITTNIGNWRSRFLNINSRESLSDSELGALLRFCSASSNVDVNNQRSKMMPIITKFYGKEFIPISTIKFNENEEEFYRVAFNFLLDYTLQQINNKDSAWVTDNKEWLLSFLEEYRPQSNEDHKKRLNDYRVLPNQLGDLCFLNDLHKRDHSIPDELVEIYKELFNKDLRKGWIHIDFESVVTFTEDTVKGISQEIDNSLAEEMKKEDGPRHFEKLARKIILKIGEDDKWKEWFGQIDEKKALYTFNMKKGPAQSSLFTIMDMEDDCLERLAKLSKGCNMSELLDKMEHQQKLERDKEARFHHLHLIGKHIEDTLRDKIGSELIKVDISSLEQNGETSADDVQDGQDIIIRVKTTDKWEDIFYIEVKSKWDFTESAHMSSKQVKKAAMHPDKYALCCVWLGDYKEMDLTTLSEDVIISNTNVKLNIGDALVPLMTGILEADNKSDETQIKISDYQSNISHEIFKNGEPFQSLLNKLGSLIDNKLQNI